MSLATSFFSNYGAANGNRNHDPTITNGVLYHWAMAANNLQKDYKIFFVKIKKKEYKHYQKKEKKDILALKLRENLIRRKKSKK